MAVNEMTVTDSLGQISEKGADGNVIDLTGSYGKYVDSDTGKNDPYHFYAMTAPYTVDNPPPDTNPVKPLAIQMVLLVGGPLSGVYRYPKIGERILVTFPDAGDTDNNNYLLGYVPSGPVADDAPSVNDFFDKSEADIVDQEVFDCEGLMIRHKNTASAFEGYAKKFSEIGFFKNAEAEWPATEGGDYYPSIEAISIDSAGDLRETASNHYLQQSKRMEILANTPEMNHRTCRIDFMGTLPLGDYLGDDSSLHKGDAHIRAGNRAVIKAAREIRLQVGRTMLRIGDDGFNVITRNVCGNYINSYDTSLSMTPRDGIAINGKNINLQAGYRLNMGDGMGGAIASAMGNLSMSGREISLDSFNALEYKFMAALQGLEYLVNAASGGMALSGEADVRIAEYIKFATDNLKNLVQLGKRFNSVLAERKSNHIKLEEQRAERDRQMRAHQDDGIPRNENRRVAPASAPDAGGGAAPAPAPAPVPAPDAGGGDAPAPVPAPDAGGGGAAPAPEPARAPAHASPDDPEPAPVDPHAEAFRGRLSAPVFAQERRDAVQRVREIIQEVRSRNPPRYEGYAVDLKRVYDQKMMLLGYSADYARDMWVRTVWREPFHYPFDIN
jgi:hypothetical protein